MTTLFLDPVPTTDSADLVDALAALGHSVTVRPADPLDVPEALLAADAGLYELRPDPALAIIAEAAQRPYAPVCAVLPDACPCSAVEELRGEHRAALAGTL